MKPRVPVSFTLDLDVLTRARSMIGDDKLFEILQTALDTALDHEAASVGATYVAVPTNGKIRVYKDPENRIWVAWLDVCRSTLVTNPYQEGRKVQRNAIPINGRPMIIVRAEDAKEFVKGRRVRVQQTREALDELEAALSTRIFRPAFAGIT